MADSNLTESDWARLGRLVRREIEISQRGKPQPNRLAKEDLEAAAQELSAMVGTDREPAQRPEPAKDAAVDVLLDGRAIGTVTRLPNGLWNLPDSILERTAFGFGPLLPACLNGFNVQEAVKAKWRDRSADLSFRIRKG